MFDYRIPFANINRNMAALAAPPVKSETLVRPPSVAAGASYELSAVHAPIIAPLSRNALAGFAARTSLIPHYSLFSSL